MIKENQRILNSLLVVIDVLVILFSLILAYYVRFKTTLFGPLGGSLPFMHYLIFTIVCIIRCYTTFLDYTNPLGTNPPYSLVQRI